MPAELRSIPLSLMDALRRNPQHMTAKQSRALRDSIRRDGFLVPVLLRPRGERYEVIAGNHRVAAARDVGLTEIPAVVADLDDKAAQRIAVNTNTVHGDPTAELLAPFLAEMDASVLAEVHLDDDLASALCDFDSTLAAALAASTMPDSLARESPQHAIHTCVCPRCGKKHARQQRDGDE